MTGIVIQLCLHSFTGPIAERSGKSVSSLEEFDISLEVGDQEALDDFLGTEEDINDSPETVDEEEKTEEEAETKDEAKDEDAATKKDESEQKASDDGSTKESEDEGKNSRVSSILSDESSAGDESGIMGGKLETKQKT